MSLETFSNTSIIVSTYKSFHKIKLNVMCLANIHLHGDTKGHTDGRTNYPTTLPPLPGSPHTQRGWARELAVDRVYHPVGPVRRQRILQFWKQNMDFYVCIIVNWRECVYVRAWLCVCICACMHVCMCKRLCMCVHVLLRMCECVF
jgi:hypothetical protein